MDVPSSMPAYPTGDGDSKPLTIGELEQLMTALGAAGAVLLEAANLMEELVAYDGAAGAIEKLQSLQGVSWRLGFRADALCDDVLRALPEVAERLNADEPDLSTNANGSLALN